jgi:TolB protein
MIVLPEARQANRTILRATLLAALALLPSGCGKDGNSVKPAPPQTRILFESLRDGNAEIYMMNADGTGQTRLTFTPEVDSDPTWYPDRAHVLFVKVWPGGNALYRMNADGTNPLLVDSFPGQYCSSPRVSHDGLGIVCAVGADSLHTDIWLLSSDGSNAINITNTPGIPEHCPDWSPDDGHIVFARPAAYEPPAPPYGWRIYTMASTGADTLKLAETGNGMVEPRWSPDGKSIVFVNLGRDPHANSGLSYIYVMSASGGNLRPVTPLTDGSRYEPTWSPDGLKVGYRMDVATGSDIFTIGVDGQGDKNITNSNGIDLRPEWGAPPP